MKKNTDNNQEHHHLGHSHDVFNNPEMFVEKFDAPERDDWQKPDEVIQSFKLSPDARVIEIGAGMDTLPFAWRSMSKMERFLHLIKPLK
jgi:hypothetical protein